MGSWVDFYRRYDRAIAGLRVGQTALPPPYICPPAGTFADDGEDPLDAWEVSEPGPVQLAEGFGLKDLPDPGPVSEWSKSSGQRQRTDVTGENGQR